MKDRDFPNPGLGRLIEGLAKIVAVPLIFIERLQQAPTINITMNGAGTQLQIHIHHP